MTTHDALYWLYAMTQGRTPQAQMQAEPNMHNFTEWTGKVAAGLQTDKSGAGYWRHVVNFAVDSRTSPGDWGHEPLVATEGADIAIVSAKGHIVAEIRHDPDIQKVENPDFDNVVYHSDQLTTAGVLAASRDLYVAGILYYLDLPGAFVAMSEALQKASVPYGQAPA